MRSVIFVARTVLVIGAVALVIVASAPAAVEFLAERWLRQNGAPDARVGDVELNLFRGIARLEGLDAGTPRRQLRLEALFVDVSLTALTERRLLLERLDLTGLRVDAERGEDGALRVGSVRVPVPGSAPTPVPGRRRRSWTAC